MEVLADYPKKPKLWTAKGLKTLGALIKKVRDERQLSYRSLRDLIKERTGHHMSDVTLGDLEKGTREPAWRTLSIVAASEIVCKPNGVPYTVEEFCDIAAEQINPDDPAFFKQNHGTKKNALSKEEKNLHQFSYLQLQRLKALIDASRIVLNLNEAQYVRAATNNGIEADEALLFYEDVMDETLRSHPVYRIEAFLPLIFKVTKWNPLMLNQNETYEGDFQGLVKDLETLNNSGIHHRV